MAYTTDGATARSWLHQTPARTGLTTEQADKTITAVEASAVEAAQCEAVEHGDHTDREHGLNRPGFGRELR